MAPLTTQEKIDEGIARKDKGNAHFKAGELKDALRCYHEGIMYLKGLDSSATAVPGMAQGNQPDQTQKDAIKTQIAAIYSNMAAVQLKLGDWPKAIRSADQCLAVDEKNIKAFFRRAQAEFSNNDLDKAEASFKKVMTLDPSDPAPKVELQKIKERRKELERKSIKELSGMFNRGGLS